MRRTKIVCTLGPAVASEEMILALAKAGMNVARLNCAHGDWATRRLWIEWVRKAEEGVEHPIGILLDLPGPKVRLGELAEPLEVQPGQTLQLVPRSTGSNGNLPVPVPELFQVARVGDRILIDDGSVEMKVVRLEHEALLVRVVEGGQIRSRRGVTVLGRSLPLPALTEEDEADLFEGLQAGVDWVALSFVHHPSDIVALRSRMRQLGYELPIVAKIEQKEALQQLDTILEVSDAIMIARGDLGLHLALEELPLVQKQIIRACNRVAKPVITATQMLESMIQNGWPTRAEVTDVANAILDGTDAVMLSGETAIGSHPVQAVSWMAKIAERAERSLDYTRGVMALHSVASSNPTEAVAHAACALAHTLHAAAILSATTSGGTARWVSRFRPKPPILAMTPDPKISRRLTLYWGVYPLVVPSVNSTDEMTTVALEAARQAKRVKRGDRVVITAGVPVNTPGRTNLIQVQTVG